MEPETVTHLLRTWDRLVSIAQGTGPSETESDLSSSKALRKSIYAFHMAKLRHRFDKYFDPFVQAFIPEARRSKELHSDDITRLESLLDSLQAVRDAFDSTTISEDERTRNIARFIAIAEKEWRVALAVDPDKPWYQRGDDILLRCPQEVQDVLSGRSFAIRKHLAKLFSIQGHFLAFQELTRSRHFADFMRCSFHIVTVDAVHRTIVRNLRQDIVMAVHAPRSASYNHEESEPADLPQQIFDRCFLTLDTTMELTEFGGFVHGECALLAHLYNEGIAAYLYLGTSRPPCQACILFFRSYRSTVSNTLLHYFAEEKMLHAKLFPSSWVSPLLADEVIHCGAQRKMKEYMKAAYDYYVWLCTRNIEVERRTSLGDLHPISESTDSSSDSDSDWGTCRGT
ncbi:hypothetical protein BV25DRAFT_269147 [Artomyces pyxidatus]|uniref:Uncharacterized protein n=1 Tax=Artomyces pyxidatus TaxID=48021 RepID=A0ACB8T817_9AGAM|nr:hypothetical protein BV25DRAFT_269147 [Artomyces pyxidatus]